MEIRKLFDESRNIYRTIEKVITYGADQEARLKAEISEYIVTENIELQFEELLSKMQLAMDAGGENEIGVWVSGFYGSGKSSFTKYLGLALDGKTEIDGIPFLKYLQDRMTKPQTKALLTTVAQKFPAAVILLDLASEMLAGATMEEVSTVLYYKVLQWAGYSRNIKVAALERRLKKDNQYQEFVSSVKEDYGFVWEEIQDDPLIIDSLVPELAHKYYPDLFSSPSSFNTEAEDFILFENERVEEMIDIVRETSGKEYVIFIVDEVGQYVASRPNLILNIDGLAKNLKAVGDGKVWIMGTAQQTLKEDDPRAALNSPELYKLEARFPIQIDLESRDIKEICYRRLLAKSPSGRKNLATLFKNHGPELRHNAKLEDAKYYDAAFDEETFINLYPFLPAHFDILLHLLGALAKSTGGLGLRSAIKVIQDILIEGTEEQQAIAECPVGLLATTVTLFDTLEKDIQRAAPSIFTAATKTFIRFPDSEIHHQVAKTVAVLQILDNIPVTIPNVASLTHPAVDEPSREDAVKSVVDDLKSDSMVPFGEKEGSLCFFSEKINDIEQERAQLPLRSVETRRIQTEALKNAFSPLPSTRLHNTFTVTSGLKMSVGNMLVNIAGDREAIQTVVEFVTPEDYETERTRLVDESRLRTSQNLIYLLGRSDDQINYLIAEIYRSREIASRHKSDPDQEVKEYCGSQIDLAGSLERDLQRVLLGLLKGGSFIFRGETTAVENVDPNPLQAAKKYLNKVGGQVFERYPEAPLRVKTGLAEKFLRMENLNAVTADTDPLGLVKVVSGTPRIYSNHKALVSIKDYIDRSGSVDGKRLTEHFSSAPFGWSPDTLRYLVAALLKNGEIKLRISGREINVPGQQAIEGLRTNNSFKSVGVSLRDGIVDPGILAMAAERMTKLSGDRIIPLEQNISKAGMKYFPKLQQRYGSLGERLKSLNLPGADDIQNLNQDLTDIIETDASDLPQRLGSEESTLYKNLQWAGEVYQAFEQGLEGTIAELRTYLQEIQLLPVTGIPGDLRMSVEDTLAQIAERMGAKDFYKHAADLSTAMTTIKSAVQGNNQKLKAGQEDAIRSHEQELQKMQDWTELTQEEQSQTLAELDSLIPTTSYEGLMGLKQLMNQQYTIQSKYHTVREKVVGLAVERRKQRLEDEINQTPSGSKKTIRRTIKISHTITDIERLDELLAELRTIQSEFDLFSEIEIIFKVEE